MRQSRTSIRCGRSLPGIPWALCLMIVGGCAPTVGGGGAGGATVQGTGGRGVMGSGGDGGGTGGAPAASGGSGMVPATGGSAQDAAPPDDVGVPGASSGGGPGGGALDGGGPDHVATGGALGSSGGAGGGGGCSGLFCEDFEKGAIDPAIWDVKLNGGQPAPNVVTQAGLVAHGKYAGHFHANPNVTSYDVIITKSAPAALRGHHFGRAYFMITPMPPANHTQYIYAGTTGFPKYQYLEVASAGSNAWQLTYVDLVPPTTGEDYHAGGKVPFAKWFCLEWEFNDVPDQASVYVDGKLDYTSSTFTFGGATTGLVGGFAAFGFGYYAWHPATYPFDIYYDDIVLDTKRVGCLP